LFEEVGMMIDGMTWCQMKEKIRRIAKGAPTFFCFSGKKISRCTHLTGMQLQKRM